MVYLRSVAFLFVSLFFGIQKEAIASPNDNNLVVRLNMEEELLPVYMSGFQQGHAPFDANYLDKLSSILRFDLNHNGMTAVQTKDKKWDKTLANATQLSDEEWRSLPFHAFIKLSFEENSLRGEMGIRSSRALKLFQGLVLSGNLNEDRKVMHQIADTFYKELFQKTGIATTKILYTLKKNDKSPNQKWASEIWEADYDGQNPHKIIEGGYFVTPSYIPAKPGFSSGSIIYSAYKSGQPKIYVAQLNEGVGRRLSLLRGNQFMPAVAPQRDQIAFVCDVAGNPDLFIQPFSLEKGSEGKPRQIFSCGQSVQGTPTFSPDGQKIAFVSNKDGSPRIYLLDIPKERASIKDLKPKLLTKYSRESTAPAWSPDGTKIAYCSMTQGTRQIWIYDLKKQEEKQLTFGTGHKENPSWSPNSRMLVYNDLEGDNSHLYLVGLRRKEPTQIGQSEGSQRYPSWGS